MQANEVRQVCKQIENIENEINRNVQIDGYFEMVTIPLHPFFHEPTTESFSFKDKVVQ